MPDEAAYMLNALWFKKNGGAEKYAEYPASARPCLDRVGGEILRQFRPVEALVGDFDPDLTFVIRYPSIEAFREMIASPEYQAIVHLRSEAIEHAVLTRCEAVPGAAD